MFRPRSDPILRLLCFFAANFVLKSQGPCALDRCVAQGGPNFFAGGVVTLIQDEEEIVAGLGRPLDAEIHAHRFGQIVVLPQQAELQVRTKSVTDPGAAETNLKVPLRQGDFAQSRF